MSIERYWETPLRSIARFSQKIVSLDHWERLSPIVQKTLSNGFWGYNVVVFVLLFLGPRFNVIESEIAKVAAIPLIALWGVYAFHLIFIYLPSNGLYELYSYLRKKELPPSHAMLISAFTLFGVLSLFLLLVRFK